MLFDNLYVASRCVSFVVNVPLIHDARDLTIDDVSSYEGDRMIHFYSKDLNSMNLNWFGTELQD